MENVKKQQLVIGKVVNALVDFEKVHPDIWKDECWDTTMKLIEAIADLIAYSAGKPTHSERVLEHLMKKMNRLA